MEYKFKNYNTFITEGLKLVLSEGVHYESRAGLTKELENVKIAIEDNKFRETLLIGRGNNPVATTVETLWVLSGSSNAKWLSTYLPRALEYSDNGVDWANGYGPRLRNWHGKDQLISAYLELKSNPESRRCVIGINDPLYCLNEVSKDIACNLVLNFYIRDGKLNLTVMSRSMDILWGSMVNFYEWSVLQSILATWLGIQVGGYTHVVTSLHLYEPFFQKAEKIARINTLCDIDSFYTKLTSSLPSLVMISNVDDSKKIFNLVHDSIHDINYNQEFFDESLFDNSTWENYAVCCLIIGEFVHHFKNTGEVIHRYFNPATNLHIFDETLYILNNRIPCSVEKFILIEYLCRIGFISIESLSLSPIEHELLVEYKEKLELAKQC